MTRKTKEITNTWRCCCLFWVCYLGAVGLAAQVLPYDIQHPDRTLELCDQLAEISGIAYQDGQMAALQDEAGILYFINANSGEIERKMNFWKDGDYEGLCYAAGNRYWAVKSTSTLYEINDWHTRTPQVVKHKSYLDKDQDVEGVTYDAANHRLLLACKGQSLSDGDSDTYTKTRAIYAFSLTDYQMDRVPVMLLYLDEIQSYLTAHKTEDEVEDKFDNFFDENRDDLAFAPSDIDIHPITGNYYLLSAKGRFLLVLNREGKILYMEKIPKKVLRQPEGITFTPNGDMYICSEAKKGDPPKLQFFKYHNNR